MSTATPATGSRPAPRVGAVGGAPVVRTAELADVDSERWFAAQVESAHLARRAATYRCVKRGSA